jgi:methionyl-tRNA formyltransferase
MNIVYLGGKQAGVIGLLTVLAHDDNVVAVVAYDDIVKKFAYSCINLGHWLSCYSSIHDIKSWKGIDLIVSVHGREIVSDDILKLAKYGGINVHPCLSNFKGMNPIKRFLVSDKYPHASVGVHRMTSKVDEGETLKEIFVEVDGCHTEVEVYNALYPTYTEVLLYVLEMPKGILKKFDDCYRSGY